MPVVPLERPLPDVVVDLAEGEGGEAEALLSGSHSRLHVSEIRLLKQPVRHLFQDNAAPGFIAGELPQRAAEDHADNYRRQDAKYLRTSDKSFFFLHKLAKVQNRLFLKTSLLIYHQVDGLDCGRLCGQRSEGASSPSSRRRADRCSGRCRLLGGGRHFVASLRLRDPGLEQQVSSDRRSDLALVASAAGHFTAPGPNASSFS